MIRKIAVIGAGVMGHGIAQVFASAGFKSVLIDTDPKALRVAVTRIRANLRNLVELHAMPAEKMASTMDNISTTTRLDEGVVGAEFVQETIPENLRLKRSLFKDLDNAQSGAIIGSNSATIPIRKLASRSKARERILGVHWVNPPYIVPVVEVIPSSWTSKVVLRKTKQLLTEAGKVAVVCKDIPGKILARVQFAMMNEAIHLLEIGAASPEDIDNAVRLSIGVRLPVFGPLKLSDFVSTHKNTLDGLTFLYNATRDAKFKPPRLLIEKVRKHELGIWTGKGWYEYSEDYRTLANRRDRTLIKVMSALKQVGVIP